MADRIQSSLLTPRVHIGVHVLARAPEAVRSRFATPGQVMQGTLAYLHRLPPALIARWLAQKGGHIVIDDARHGFEQGPCTFRGRELVQVAWTRIDLLVTDPITYLHPVGKLLAHILGWASTPQPQTQAWRDLVQGVQRGFDAGYGRSLAAQSSPLDYLAEGIAWYLVNRRALNVADPRLEKLLRATVFNPSWYRHLDA